LLPAGHEEAERQDDRRGNDGIPCHDDVSLFRQLVGGDRQAM
jgi:hypothetical protein